MSESFVRSVVGSACLLLISVFGVCGIVYSASAWLLRKKVAPMVFWFPVIVIANYLVMAIGLALDDRCPLGESNELQHRPFVWAYLVVAAWTGGALAVLLRERIAASGLRLAAIASALVFLTLAITSGIWVGLPREPPCAITNQNIVIPNGLLECCRFLRERSGNRDVVCDSESDPRMIVTGLSERQLFVCAYVSQKQAPPDMRERKSGLKVWWQETDPALIRDYAEANGISWLLLHPEEKLSWPAQLMERHVFKAGGYSVYDLRTLTAGSTATARPNTSSLHQ